MKNIFILLFFISFSSSAQYSLLWSNSFGNEEAERAKCVVETADHGLVLVGHKEMKNDNKFMYIMKIDKDGLLKWEKTLKENTISAAESVIETDNGDIVIAGRCVKDGEFFTDCWIVKLDEYGNKIWDKNYGSEGDDGLNDIVQTQDKGFACVGYTNRDIDFGLDFLVLRLDEEGNLLWEKTFGGSKEDCGTAIIETDDHNLAVSGYTEKGGASFRSFWVMKLDEYGEEIWENAFGESSWDVATDLIETSDKGIAVTGYSKSAGLVNYDILVTKLSSEGQELWSKRIGSVNWDESTSIIETYDQGLVISAFTRSREAAFSNFRIIKLDKNGYELWNNIFERRSIDFANNVIETYDKGLLLVGSTLVATSDRSWQFAALKYVNEERPSFTFSNPEKPIAISQISEYTLKFTIESNYKIDELNIFVNGEKQYTLDKVVEKRGIRKNKENRLYDVKIKIKLKKGTNIVQLESKSFGGTGYSEKMLISNTKIPPIRW